MQTVTPTELQERLNRGEKLQLVDVRSGGEYATGHIPAAMNVPLEELEPRISDLSADSHLVLICQSGRRACLGHDAIKGDRDNLVVLEGGTLAWINAGLPVVKSTASSWSIERQVRLAAGLIVLIGTMLAVAVNPAWVYLAMFVGAGLTFAGITNLCGMAALFAVMPWNRPRVKSPKEVTA